MDLYEIIMTPDAEADLLEVRNYIADVLLVPDTALSYIKAIRKEIATLSERKQGAYSPNVSISSAISSSPENRSYCSRPLEALISTGPAMFGAASSSKQTCKPVQNDVVDEEGPKHPAPNH